MNNLLDETVASIRDTVPLNATYGKYQDVAKLCIIAMKQTMKMEKEDGFVDCPFCLATNRGESNEIQVHTAFCPYGIIKELVKEHNEANG